MATAVSICSNALLMLGENPINSFDDAVSPNGLDRARTAKNLWPSTRDSILRSHPWNCALKRVTLSPDTEAPAFTTDFSYKFTLPGDWLRNHEINGKSANEIDYKIEGRSMLCDESTLYLRYVYQNTDIGSWDAMLVEAAELAMAAKMAYPITQDKQLKQLFARELGAFLQTARAVDGQDESPATLGSFEILGARRTMP